MVTIEETGGLENGSSYLQARNIKIHASKSN